VLCLYGIFAVTLEFPSRSPNGNSHDLGLDRLPTVSKPRATGISASAGPKPRSTTPTSFRTPRRHVHQQSVTPAGGQAIRQPASTSARLRPQIQRAASSGLTIDTGSPYGAGLGHVHRSAKKWARSAHLHEVRGKKVTPRKMEEERGTVRGLPAGKENDPKDGGDVFSTARTAGEGREGKGKNPLVFGIDSPLFMFSRRNSIDDGSSGDPWVDTDVDGSEADSESVFSQSPVISVKA
jgi:hypothetical protein